MSTFVIPTATDLARYSIEVELDKTDFRFDFEWNERAGQWSFTISDAQGVALVSGRRVVLGLPLLNRFRDPRLPPGMLTAVDTSDSNLEPGFADLGDRVLLLYIEVADLPDELILDVT